MLSANINYVDFCLTDAENFNNFRNKFFYNFEAVGRPSLLTLSLILGSEIFLEAHFGPRHVPFRKRRPSRRRRAPAVASLTFVHTPLAIDIGEYSDNCGKDMKNPRNRQMFRGFFLLSKEFRNSGSHRAAIP